MSEAERKVEALTQQIEEQMELQEKHGEYYGETWGSAREGRGGGIGTGARGEALAPAARKDVGQGCTRGCLGRPQDALLDAVSAVRPV